MTITYPVDFLATFPGWTTVFEPLFRQEQSRVSGGRTYLKDLGPALWSLTAQSRQLSPNELDYWRARLESMRGGLQTFIGYSMSRFFPILYPKGAWPTGGAFNGEGTLLSVGTNRNAISVGGLPTGYVVSIGDLVQVGTDLHRAMETSTANGDGETTDFEVFPNIWPGVVAGDSPVVTVTVKRPSCVMAIVPGSIQSQADPQTGWGAVSFQAIEAR